MLGLGWGVLSAYFQTAHHHCWFNRSFVGSGLAFGLFGFLPCLLLDLLASFCAFVAKGLKAKALKLSGRRKTIEACSANVGGGLFSDGWVVLKSSVSFDGRLELSCRRLSQAQKFGARRKFCRGLLLGMPLRLI